VHQLNTARLKRQEAQAAWQAGWLLLPQSPGSRPGLLCGRAQIKDRDPVRHGHLHHTSPLARAGGLRRGVPIRQSQAQAAWQAGWQLLPQSPGSRPGLLCGREAGVALASSPALQASAGRMPKRSLHGVSAGRMPKRTSGEMARATPAHPGGCLVPARRPCKRGGSCSRSPRARARGFYAGEDAGGHPEFCPKRSSGFSSAHARRRAARIRSMSAGSGASNRIRSPVTGWSISIAAAWSACRSSSGGPGGRPSSVGSITPRPL
jgi:hypothetical protein